MYVDGAHENSVPETRKRRTESNILTNSERTVPQIDKNSAIHMRRQKLSSAKFRLLNEQLYTTSGQQAYELFSKQPNLFNEYHEGYRIQVGKWPQNPLDTLIAKIRNMPRNKVIGDFGCGDARLSASVEQKVYSFDLVALNERVTACNIARVPLDACTLDVAVFCLSLMGSDFISFLREAHRTLRKAGMIMIAEVRSRFDENNYQPFIDAVQKLGFRRKQTDDKNTMFVLFTFVKVDCSQILSHSSKSRNSKSLGQHSSLSQELTILKPCLYKKR